VADRYKNGTGIDPIFAGGGANSPRAAQRPPRDASNLVGMPCAQQLANLATATFPKLFSRTHA